MANKRVKKKNNKKEDTGKQVLEEKIVQNNSETYNLEDLSKKEVVEEKKQESKDLLEIIVKNDVIKKQDSKYELEDKKQENKENKKSKKIIPILIISFCFALLLLFCSVIIINKTNTKVYKNVYLLEVDFSNKTPEEVMEILKTKSEEITKDRMLEIYQGNETVYTVRADEMKLELDVAKTTKKILAFGRTNNIIKDNLLIIKNLFSKTNIEPVYSYDESKVEDFVKNIDLSLKDRFVDDSYNLDEKSNKLIIKRGKTGNTIDYDFEKNNIIDAIKKNETKLILNSISKKPSSLDLQKVHDEVKKDPKDAYIDKSVVPSKFVAEQIGYEFNVKELENILNSDENKTEEKVVEYPLTVLQPKIKIEDITYTLYKDKLSGYTTYFDGGLSPRANNLNIALSYLNGKIIMPGEVFSYNKAIGDTTAAKGYKEAATFKAGTVVMEMGGGICQTTSTLYNVALMANLEIVERHQHGLPVGYVPPSRDATVYSPVLDFKFKNTRNYPIKIVTSFSSAGNMNISIFGTKEETEYEVVLTSNVLSTIAFTTKYIYDDTLAKDQQVVKSAGVNGYISQGFITKKLNGVVQSSNLLSKDIYNAQQQVIRVGTK
jgi:vancomycin resistance protein YoaR